MKKIFKVEAEGDTLYIKADSQLSAQCILTETIGPIPLHLLTWSEVDRLPEGEELLNA